MTDDAGSTGVAGAPYIAIEGPEGCGKSTHAARLAASLGAVCTRETGGTPLGHRVRDILHDPATGVIDPRSEALLVAADRAQHRASVIAPVLDSGSIVVSDRSVYSTLAYQGYGRGVDLDELRTLNDWALDGRWPTVVVLLEIDQENRAARLASRRLDRFEQEDDAFHQRVVQGYRAMAAADRDRWIVVDARGDVDDVATTIAELVGRRLGDRT